MRPPALVGVLLALGLFIARRRRVENETLEEVA
jgi:hypothetical protein